MEVGSRSWGVIVSRLSMITWVSFSWDKIPDVRLWPDLYQGVRRSIVLLLLFSLSHFELKYVPFSVCQVRVHIGQFWHQKASFLPKNRRKIKAKYQALSWNWYWLCCCCCYQVDNYLHIKGLVLWLWLQIQDSWGAARPLDAGLAIQIYLVDSKSVRRSLGLGTTLFSESCLIISSIYKACSSSWRAANFFNMTKTNMK